MLSVSHYTITWGLFNEKLQRNKYFKKSLHNSKNTAEIPPMYFVYTYFVQLGKNFDDNCGFKMFLKYIQEKVLLNHLEKYIVNLKIQFLFRHFDPVCTYGYFCAFLQIRDKIIDMRTQKL